MENEVIKYVKVKLEIEHTWIRAYYFLNAQGVVLELILLADFLPSFFGK